MSDYLESLANDPSITVYNAMCGEFIKHGDTLDDNPDAETVTLDSIYSIRTFREIMDGRRAIRKNAATAVQ